MNIIQSGQRIHIHSERHFTQALVLDGHFLSVSPIPPNSLYFMFVCLFVFSNGCYSPSLTDSPGCAQSAGHVVYFFFSPLQAPSGGSVCPLSYIYNKTPNHSMGRSVTPAVSLLCPLGYSSNLWLSTSDTMQMRLMLSGS